MANILLIGGTGNVGSATSQQLSARNIPHDMMLRAGKTLPAWVDKNVNAVTGDIENVESLTKAFAGYEALFVVFPFRPDMDRLAQNIATAAAATGVKRIVRSSGAGADENAAIEMGRIQFRGDEAIRQFGGEWTILRPITFMQNMLMNVETIKSQGAIYAPLGDGAVPYIDISDIGEAAAIVLTEGGHSGKNYDLTGPAPLTMQDIARKISQYAGKEVTYTDVTEEQANQAMMQAGMPKKAVELVAELNAVSKAGYLKQPTPDLENLLGHPPTNFEGFLETFGAAFKD